MKQENKLMRLELQRIRMHTSDIGSAYAGDTSPKSFAAVNKSGHAQSTIYLAGNPANNKEESD